MKKYLIIIYSLIAFHFYGQTAGSWYQKADFGGNQRYGAVGFSIDGKGYISKGNDVTQNARNDFWEYDPITNTWTQKANFAGTIRANAVSFVIGTKGYVGTGVGGFRIDFFEYDPSTNIWTQKANFAGAGRWGAVGFGIDSFGYVGTGFKSASPHYLNDFWKYSPATNTWTQLANFGGTARELAVGFSIGSKGYIGTGYGSTGYKNDFWEYNPAINTWTQKANFGGTARYGAVGFSIGTLGYVGTGYDGTEQTDFWLFDPAANAWAQLTSFSGVARESAVGFSIDNEGYIGTGWNQNAYYNDFWMYETVTAPLPIELLNFNASPMKSTVLCKWTTATEINNEFFTVERSKDGKVFEELGKVNGAGNSNSQLNYSFIDKQPYSGLSYYRLKQTDFNGKYTYFNIVSVLFGSKNDYVIYPNPTTSLLNIHSNNVSSELTIYDVTGKEVYNITISGIDNFIDVSKCNTPVTFLTPPFH